MRRKPKLQVVKEVRGIAIAHRQPLHQGKCQYLHGHNYDLVFGVEAASLDENSFVVDVEILGEIGDEIKKMMDHHFLIAAKDKQLLNLFQGSELAKVIIVPSTSIEYIALWLAEVIESKLKEKVEDFCLRKLKVAFVRLYETSNSYVEVRF